MWPAQWNFSAPCLFSELPPSPVLSQLGQLISSSANPALLFIFRAIWVLVGYKCLHSFRLIIVSLFLQAGPRHRACALSPEIPSLHSKLEPFSTFSRSWHSISALILSPNSSSHRRQSKLPKANSPKELLSEWLIY